MKNAVIVRHIDEIGRVAIPAEFRRELNLSAKEDVNVHISEPDEKGVFTLTTNSEQPNAVIQHELGFLAVQQAYRYEYTLNGSSMDLWIEDGKLRMKKTVPQCAVSGATDNLIRYRDTDRYLSEQVIREMFGQLNSK